MAAARKSALVGRRHYAAWKPVRFEVSPGTVEEFADYCGIARDYAERCVDGRQLVCRYVRLAAKRFLRMQDTSAKPRSAFYWSPVHVADVCSFIENLPHVDSDQYGPLIVLEPWQIWKIAAIYGFRRRADSTRLVRWVYDETPRKSAKSTLLAGLALYGLTCEGERAPSIYIGAATRDQAGKVFGPASMMVHRDGELAERFGLKAMVRRIHCAENLGSIETITSVGEHQDGHNPHMVLLEELHAQKPALYHVMRSSFGSRKNPLLFQITTAGRVAAGIAWDQRKRAIRVLESVERADEVFAVIYTIDKEDENPFAERSLIKANPMWGISVDPVKAIEYANEVKGTPAGRAEFLRTRLNIWSNAAEALLQIDDWEKCESKALRIEAFAGRKAWIGVDLASRRDMAAVAIIFEDGDKLAVFCRFFIPSDAPAFLDPDLSGLYQGWVDGGFVTTTGPGVIDFSFIKEHIEALCRAHDVQAIAFDPYQANQLSAELVEQGLPALTFVNNARNMSEPTDDVRSLVETGGLVHDGHPVLTWNAANVVGYRDNRGNVLPKKEAPNSTQKIDGIHAAIFADGCRLQSKRPEKEEPKKPHPWATRGMLGATSHPSIGEPA